MSEGSVLLTDNRYPLSLKSVPNPPHTLYYTGMWNPQIFKNCLGIVGSRYISNYGVCVLNHVFSTLDKSLTIVSGFMTGVDTYAHGLALQYGMKTIAVLPSGINLAYPKENTSLYKKMLSTNNLIISEYPNKILPLKYMFIKRNRIIAGLCKALLVIEAKESSGSLITASFANKFGRKVFAVPNSIFYKNSWGCIDILNSYATAIKRGNDINKYFEETEIKTLS